MSLEKIVETASAAAGPEPRDAAALELALTYARLIDSLGDAVLIDVGPKLLAVLESLQLTPRARAAAQKVTSDDKPRANPIDELNRRRLGKSATPTLDAAAP